METIAVILTCALLGHVSFRNCCLVLSTTCTTCVAVVPLNSVNNHCATQMWTLDPACQLFSKVQFSPWLNKCLSGTYCQVLFKCFINSQNSLLASLQWKRVRLEPEQAASNSTGFACLGGPVGGSGFVRARQALRQLSRSSGFLLVVEVMGFLLSFVFNFIYHWCVCVCVFAMAPVWRPGDPGVIVLPSPCGSQGLDTGHRLAGRASLQLTGPCLLFCFAHVLLMLYLCVCVLFLVCVICWCVYFVLHVCVFWVCVICFQTRSYSVTTLALNS